MTTALGGPPIANQNARQHGLYSQKDPLPPGEQIPALRAYIADLAAKAADLQTPQEIARVLRRLTLASMALSRLIRASLIAPANPRAELVEARPGFGYPRSRTCTRQSVPAPCSHIRNPQSAIPNRFLARFPFIHPVVYNLTHLLFGPSGSYVPGGRSP